MKQLDFCSRILSKKLKDLNFNENCIKAVQFDEVVQGFYFNNNSGSVDYTIPLYYQVVSWLDINYDIEFNVKSENGKYYYVYKRNSQSFNYKSKEKFDCREIAFDEGLNEIIDLIIDRLIKM